MGVLSPTDIFIEFKKGTLAKATTVDYLISYIENDLNSQIREDSIKILEKLEIKSDRVFNLLEAIVISDTDFILRGLAADLMIRWFPKKSVEPLMWALRIRPYEIFNRVFDVVWWSENKDWGRLKEELYKKIKDNVQKYINEGVYAEEAVILALFGGSLIKAKIYDTLENMNDHYGSLKHYKIDEARHVKGFYFVPHSDSISWPFLPESISNLKNLEEFIIIGCSLESIPKSIGKLKYLKSLDFSCNSIKELPESVGDLDSLEILNLEHNMIQGLPESIGNLQRLKSLNINENQLKSLPNTIGNLSSLMELNLRGNKLCEIPESIGNLSSLMELNLRGNKLREVPKSIGNLTSLKKLYFNGNGNIKLSDSMRFLTNLEVLSFGGANIKVIPDWIGNFTLLERLGLDNNNIEGISDSIMNLKSLKYLSLSNNRMTEIPESLCAFNSLLRLGINDNKIKKITNSIENLTSLIFLNLNNNYIEEIPKVLINLKIKNNLDLKLTNNEIVVFPDLINVFNDNLAEISTESFIKTSPLTDILAEFLNKKVEGPIKRKQYKDSQLLSEFNEAWALLCKDNDMECEEIERNNAFKFVNKYYKKYQLFLNEAIGLRFLKIVARKVKANYQVNIFNGQVVGIKIYSDNLINSKVFEFFPNLLHLAIESTSLISFKADKTLKNLELLFIRCKNMTDFEILEPLTNLKRLLVINSKITKISVSNLVNLEQLRLEDNKINQISGLGNLLKLREFDISGNPIFQLDGIERLLDLTYCSMRMTNIPDSKLRKYEKLIEENRAKKENNSN